MQQSKDKIKYIATVNNVREIALLGSADLPYWQHELTNAVVEPIPSADEANPRAQILLTAVSGKWSGIPFREFAVAIMARTNPLPEEAQAHDEAVGDSSPSDPSLFLAAAFNTSRIFTFFERHWFHTPYQWRKDLQLELGSAPHFQLGKPPSPDIRAQFAPLESAITTTQQQEIDYRGKLHLPNRRDSNQGHHHYYFNVKLQGHTTITTYDPATDHFQVSPDTKIPILIALLKSNFQPTHWHLRRNATHARSKTDRTSAKSQL